MSFYYFNQNIAISSEKMTRHKRKPLGILWRIFFFFFLFLFAENWADSTMVNRISCTGPLLAWLKYFVFGNFTTCQFVEVVKNMGIANSQEKVYTG